jgi:membrane associated rhomboid family serine protease
MSANPQLIKIAENLIDAAERYATGERQPKPPNEFRDALRERGPRAIVTPALAALNVGVFFYMAFYASGPIADQKTLIEWGASFGPRTTNGEWWRIVTAMFLHAGFFHLLVNVAGLVQTGLIVERLLGPLALASTYLAAGVYANLTAISGDPLSVTYGASAAIFSVYGLLLSTFVLGLRKRSPATIPIHELKKLAPAAVIFMLVNMGAAGPPSFAGVVVGLLSGIVLAIGVSEQQAPLSRVAVTFGAAAIAIVMAAVPHRGIADVRPEIARITALEEQTTTTYDAAIRRFTTGMITGDGLAKHIDKDILPKLVAEQTRLRAIQGVPPQHKPVVAAADEYLTLRQESFRLRLEALRKTQMKKLKQAETTETAAREAFAKIKLSEPSS